MAATPSLVLMTISVTRNSTAGWGMLLAGQLVFFAGDVRYYVWDPPFPDLVGNLLYVAAYPLWLAGLWKLLRGSLGRFQGRSIADVALIAVCVSITYVTILLSYAQTSTFTERMVLSLFPVADCLILAGMIWLLTEARVWSASWRLMIWAFGALLVTDFVYHFAEVTGDYPLGSLLDLGWLGFYALLATAAYVRSVALT